MKFYYNDSFLGLWRLKLTEEKECEIQSGIIKTIKTQDAVENLRKVSFMEALFLRHLLPILLIVVLLFTSNNSYYPSQTSIFFGISLFIVYSFLKRKYLALAIILLAITIIGSLLTIVYNFELLRRANTMFILLATVQNFFYFNILNFLIIDFFSVKSRSWYKINSNSFNILYYLTPSKYVNTNAVFRNKINSMFIVFLIIPLFFSFTLGFVDYVKKIKTLNYLQDSKDTSSNTSITYRSFLKKLNLEAATVGINFHSGAASLKLMKKDLESYKKNGVIGYANIKLTQANTVFEQNTNKKINLLPNGGFLIIKAYKKFYKGTKRWCFIMNKHKYVVIDVEAK